MTQPLHTDRLDLEPVTVEHAAQAWPHVGDERLWRYFPELRPRTLDDLRRLYGKWQRGSRSEDAIWLNYVCRERSTKRLVGNVQATIHTHQRAAHLAYAIYSAHQRSGYAREACIALIEHLRVAHNIERIVAEMDTRNEASYKLAESLGFRRTSVHHGVKHGHERADEYVYELQIANASGEYQ